ncbi:hypothetical protein ACFQ9X_07560 [Catenulispora yoronensis]
MPRGRVHLLRRHRRLHQRRLVAGGLDQRRIVGARRGRVVRDGVLLRGTEGWSPLAEDAVVALGS